MALQADFTISGNSGRFPVDYGQYYEILFNPNAYLHEESANLMKQEVKEPANYNAIVEAIAKGATKLNEISS